MMGLWTKGGVGFGKRMGAVFGRVKFGLKLSSLIGGAKKEEADAAYALEDEGAGAGKKTSTAGTAGAPLSLAQRVLAGKSNPAPAAWAEGGSGVQRAITDDEYGAKKKSCFCF